MPVYMLVDTYTLTGMLVYYHVHSIYLHMHRNVFVHTHRNISTHI